MGREDIKAAAHQYGSLKWDAASMGESLIAIFQRGEMHASVAIKWYLDSKGSKKIWAQSLRLGVIAFTALAGLLPMLSQITDEAHRIQPAWSSVALGIAGLFLAIDRFFGFSTGWMRFIITEHQIRQALHTFQMECEGEMAMWKSGQPTLEQVLQGVARTKAFLYQIDDLIRKETEQWLAEFQNAIREIDEMAKIKMALPENRERTGAINVMVTNGDQIIDGWQLTVDGNTPATYHGKSAALNDLAVTTHVLRVEGVIKGAKRVSEKAVQVPAGGVVEVEITL